MTTVVPRPPAERETERPVPPRVHRAGAGTVVLLVALVALHVVAWRNTGISVSALADGGKSIANFFSGALPPDFDWHAVVETGVKAALVAFYIGLLGTTLSIPFAFVLALLASRATTSNSVVFQSARSLLSTLRAIPAIVFALIFVAAVGLGAFPGVLALVHERAVAAGRMPWLAGVSADGGTARPSVCAMPALTNPNNVSIATGAAPSVHGISGNQFGQPVAG